MRLLAKKRKQWYQRRVRGIDTATLFDATTWDCLRTTYGYERAVVRAYHSYGGVDTNAPVNLANIAAAGFPIADVYHFPCYGKAKTGELPASQQVSDMVKYLASTNSTYATVWFDVEDNPSTGCAWETDAANYQLNCKFMGDLIAAGFQYNLKMGVYASSYMWSKIAGSTCTIASSQGVLLWYAHWDNVLAFTDFTPFGGWTTPTMKQYTDQLKLCKFSKEDGDWYP
eukprot:TRINITY_DN1124_c0_g1_i5.p1 TRINITY_DN1124_c0_g1~~TRINITY_DN1124_c0_g1_i5.p1  ORF type:complete len:227 (-),score=69.32 TRINITY_DN1124_c0_g1_i5:182-862(-)